jgi:hypothetical protein
MPFFTVTEAELVNDAVFLKASCNYLSKRAQLAESHSGSYHLPFSKYSTFSVDILFTLMHTH